MSSNQTELTDPQRRALLRAEVQKLQAAGMDYTRAFTTASEAHPEWRTVGPLNRPRRTGAQMLNDGASGDAATRTEQVQRLVREYCQQHGLDPLKGGDYTTAYTRVLQMHPDIAKQMRQPGRTPANLLGKLGKWCD